jgi:hypothetical protein
MYVIATGFLGPVGEKIEPEGGSPTPGRPKPTGW